MGSRGERRSATHANKRLGGWCKNLNCAVLIGLARQVWMSSHYWTKILNGFSRLMAGKPSFCLDCYQGEGKKNTWNKHCNIYSLKPH